MPYHAATHYPPVDISETETGPVDAPGSEYFGIVDDAHVASVHAIASDPDIPRFVKQHPSDTNQFFVVRDDGMLDHYVYVTPEEAS